MNVLKNKKDFLFPILFCCCITLSFEIFTIWKFYFCLILGFIYTGLLEFIFKIVKMLLRNNDSDFSSKTIFDIRMLIYTPFLWFFIFEIINQNGLTVFGNIFSTILNLLFYSIANLIILFLTRKGNLALIINTMFFLLISIINGYVVTFRGYGFSYVDIHSITTAIHVAEEYSYIPSWTQIWAMGLSVVICILSWKNSIEIKKHRNILSIMAIFCLSFYIFVLSYTPFYTKIGFEPKFYWEHPNGFIVNTLAQIQVIHTDRMPEDYSIETVNEILNKFNEVQSDTSKVIPTNVICIMNETLTDLTVYDNFNVGYDPLAYMKSLKENTISGYTYSSVFGGVTVISEYEFLSNNSSAFFGSTMSPYSTFVNENSYSLIKQLEPYGYNKTFLHPYKDISYNRPNAYKKLGMDNQAYELDLLKEYGNEYWTDSGLYKIITSKTEKEDKTFIFTVTIQNHSPFNLMDDYNVTLPETTYSEKTNKYLSLIQHSDSAIKELIEYYSNCNEPTIIVLFGDHQPRLDSDFYEDVNKKTLTETLKDPSLIAYKTPFVIWANYDIKEQENVEVSINYLSTLMLEQTGIEKTSYQHFLTSIRDDLPIITVNGIIDKDGNYYETIEDLSDELYVLAHQYQILEYNMIFDKENKVNNLERRVN